MLTGLLILAEEGGNTSSGGGSWYFLVMIALFAAIFYFLIWRPQQKRMRSQMELMESVKVGDEVVTQGGIYGYITELEDDTLLLEVSEGVDIRVARSSILRNLSAAERAERQKEKEKAEEEAGTEESEEEAAADDREGDGPGSGGNGKSR